MAPVNPSPRLTISAVLRAVFAVSILLPYILLKTSVQHTVFPKNGSNISFGKRLTTAATASVLPTIPLSVVQRLATLFIGTGKKVLESTRYSRIRSQILLHVQQSQFSGYWICRGLLPQPIDPKDADIVFLYIHGGGYAIGHPMATAPDLLLVAELLSKQDITCAIFALEYSLIPNACFPVQLNQALAAYNWLIHDLQVDRSKLSLVGESAGGHLIISLLVGLSQKSNALEHTKAPGPRPAAAAAFLLSPWLDLYNTNPRTKNYPDQDSVNSPALHQCADLLLRDTLPETSDLYTNFVTPKTEMNWQSILPSTTWISHGTEEPLFMFDIEDFAMQAKKAGARVLLEAELDAEHAWQSQDAMKHHKAFLRQPFELDDERLMSGHRKLTLAIIEVLGFNDKVDESK